MKYKKAATYFLIVICLMSLLNSSFEYCSRIHIAYKVNDFNHYYATAHLSLNENTIYGYDFSRLSLLDGFEWDPAITAPTNPPFLVSVTAFLAVFGPQFAWVIWQITLFTSVCLIAWQLMFLYKVEISIARLFIIIVLLLSVRSVAESILYSQVQTIILALLLTGVRNHKLNRHTWAGIFYGTAIITKLFLLPIVLFLLGIKAWKTLVYTILTICVCVLITCLIHGYDIWRDYFLYGMELSLKYAKLPVVNYSIPVFLINLTQSVLSIKISNAAWSGVMLTMQIVNFSLAYILGRNCKMKVNFLQNISLAMACTTLLLPVAWGHAIIFLLPHLICVLVDCNYQNFKNTSLNLYFATQFLVCMLAFS